MKSGLVESSVENVIIVRGIVALTFSLFMRGQKGTGQLAAVTGSYVIVEMLTGKAVGGEH